MSRLKVNLNKSELVPMGEVANLMGLVNILGCKVGSLPLTYIGLPLGSIFKVNNIWCPVVEKVGKQLAG